MPSKSLGLRLILLLAAVLAVYGLVHSIFVASSLREQSRREARVATLRLADTVARSIRYDMLGTRREHIYEVIDDIGRQDGIDFVRVVDDRGRIVYSTRRGEAGRVLATDEAACVQCHRGTTPEVSLIRHERARVYESSEGHPSLAVIAVVDNDPSCSTAACHAHPADQNVLGVIDVGVSLEEAEQRVASTIRTTTIFVVVSIGLVCFLVALFLHRFVSAPVRRLVTGTQRIAAGDLDVAIPVESRDELGQLAASFNTMAVDLREARGEIDSWTDSLETQVEEKSRELEAAQAQVLRAEKLSSLGLLAAGVAHELNSPLTGIITFSHLLLRKAPEASQEREDLGVIVHEAERCASIIRQLLDFAHTKPPAKTEQNINDVIERALSLVEHQASFHDVEILRDLSDDLPLSKVDGDQFEQIFLNLAINAAEAMPDGGVLSITTRGCRQGPDAPRASQEKLVIEITDTGVGIPPEKLGKIFDPFFTSKDVGEGTGLGLAVTYGIVKRHGGKIAVESAENEGTTFTITIPCAGEGAAP